MTWWRRGTEEFYGKCLGITRINRPFADMLDAGAASTPPRTRGKSSESTNRDFDIYRHLILNPHSTREGWAGHASRQRSPRAKGSSVMQYSPSCSSPLCSARNEDLSGHPALPAILQSPKLSAAAVCGAQRIVACER